MIEGIFQISPGGAFGQRCMCTGASRARANEASKIRSGRGWMVETDEPNASSYRDILRVPWDRRMKEKMVEGDTGRSRWH